MKQRIFKSFADAASACAIVAVALLGGLPAMAADPQPIIVENLASARLVVQSTPGVPIAVAMPVTPGTGYAWEVASALPAGLQFTGSKTVPLKPGLPGGPAHQILTFIDSATGSGEVTLVLRQSWMPPDTSDRRFVLIFQARS